MRESYLNMGNDNIKAKESFLNSYFYDKKRKKTIKNWYYPSKLEFCLFLKDLSEEDCLGSIETISENFSQWKNWFPNYKLETSFSLDRQRCGDYSPSFELWGKREESDEEFLLRQKIMQQDLQEE